MTLTLTANIDAADRYLTVTGTVPDDIEPTYRFRLGNELLELQAFVVRTREVGRAGTFVDRNEWYVLRGLDTTDPASHTAGDEVKGATDAYAAAESGTTPPSPFSSGGGGGLPTGWTQDPESGAVDTGGQDFSAATTTVNGNPVVVSPAGGDLDMNGNNLGGVGTLTLTNGGIVNSNGDDFDMGGGKVTNLDDPAAGSDAATKDYVDNNAPPFPNPLTEDVFLDTFGIFGGVFEAEVGSLEFGESGATLFGAGGIDAAIEGGDDAGATGGSVTAKAGVGPSTHGLVAVRTNNTLGASGQALVSNGSSSVMWGGVSFGAVVPVSAPNGQLPFHYDSTAVTGGFYFWNGSAWVKVATIL